MSAPVLLVSLGGVTSDRIADPLIARGYDVQSVSGITAAGRALEGRELVIVDAAGAGVAADACSRLRKRTGSHLPILAVAPSDGIDDRIALFEAGADDVLQPGFDARELEALIEALLARRRPTPPAEEDDEPAQEQEVPAAPGRVIVFGGPKGGAGTTTLAVNTALLLAEKGAGVAIADLDLHHGQVGTHLDVMGGQSTANLARDEHLIENPLAVRQSAVLHVSGLSVFTSGQRPDESALVTVDDVIHLVGALRRAYTTVVVDAGSVVGSRAMALIAVADRSVIVVNPDIPGLRAVQGALEAMADAGVLGEHTRYVLNQPYAHAGIEQADIERHLAVQVAVAIPYDGENAMRAVNEGQPLASLAPRSPASDALRRLAALVVDEEAPEPDVSPAERRGLLGSLLRRD